MGLPNPGIKLGSPALQGDSLPTELSGKPYKRNNLASNQQSPTFPTFPTTKTSCFLFPRPELVFCLVGSAPCSCRAMATSPCRAGLGWGMSPPCSGHSPRVPCAASEFKTQPFPAEFLRGCIFPSGALFPVESVLNWWAGRNLWGTVNGNTWQVCHSTLFAYSLQTLPVTPGGRTETPRFCLPHPALHELDESAEVAKYLSWSLSQSNRGGVGQLRGVTGAAGDPLDTWRGLSGWNRLCD